MAIRVLYAHSASRIGGANKVLLSLLRGLDRSQFEPVSIIPEPGLIEDELRALSVPYSILDLRPNSRNRLHSAARAIRAAALLSRVDMVHANDFNSYRMLSFGARLHKVRAICHIHHPVKSAPWLRTSLKRAPDAILTPTTFMRERLTEQLGSRHLIYDVGNPVDTDWFSPLSAARDRERPRITIMGAVAPHKGHDCFLRMARQVLRRFPKASFHIVGSIENTEWAETLKLLAVDLGVAVSVIWHGFTSDAQARDLLRASDLFVLPSKEEGFCLAVAEAQACAVPVLSSFIRPLDEVVQDQKSGFLIDPTDDETFAQRAIEILDNPKMSAEMGAAGRRFIAERYGLESFLGRVLSHYTVTPRP